MLFTEFINGMLLMGIYLYKIFGRFKYGLNVMVEYLVDVRSLWKYLLASSGSRIYFMTQGVLLGSEILFHREWNAMGDSYRGIPTMYSHNLFSNEKGRTAL